MLIRPLTRADVESFRKLRREMIHREPRSFGESLSEHDARSPESLARRLESEPAGSFVMGAFAEGGELAAMAGFVRNPRVKARHKGLIWGVYVRPERRKQGIARAVLSKLIERVKSDPEIEKILLTVAADQVAAQRLYRSLGFEVFGEEKHALRVDNGYVDEDHMVLWLRR
jgi:ribosomal protein S18 acetylase RimI-like enzyme